MLLISLSSIGQIKGTIIENDSSPVEFAKILNITKKSNSISNSDGEFVIEGILGDSIQIQHINYIGSCFRIAALNDRYLLMPKNYILDEVVVSSDYAFKLLKKSCVNTFSKLKDRSVVRGYLRYLKTENNDTIILQDIDLDIERVKLKSFDDGEKISIFKIQERTLRDSLLEGRDLKLSKYICPPVNQFDWDVFSKSYNHFKVEDSQYIKLYFFSKESLPDYNVHFEVIIQKEDTCLLIFAKTHKGSFRSKNGEKTGIVNSYSYTNYGIENGFSFIAETFDNVILTNPVNKKKKVVMFLHYKTFDNGIQNSRLRPKGHKIQNNIFDPSTVKNRYADKFWLYNSGLGSINYDFENLSNLKIE